MSNNTPETAAAVRDACQAAASSISEALQRAFDTVTEVSVGDPQTCESSAAPDQLAGAGLVFAFTLGEGGALALLPVSSGWVPAWCTSPDEEGTQKLAKLAAELGSSLLPESLGVSDAQVGQVVDLAESLRRAVPTGEIGIVPLDLSAGEEQAQLFCILPVVDAQRALDPTSGGEATSSSEPDATSGGEPTSSSESDATGGGEATSSSEPDATSGGEATSSSEPDEERSADVAEEGANQQGEEPKSESPSPSRVRLRYTDLEDGIRQLPPYARSLLRIKVPVIVKLAQTKIPVHQVTNLATGSIIQFDKPCDASLTLEIGNQEIAEGEAVKVGDKFGLWITTMSMPGERFWVIHGQRAQLRVK